MNKTRVIDTVVPGDPSRTALGVCLRIIDIERALRPGLHLVEEAIVGLAAKAREVLAEIDSPANALAGTDSRLLKIKSRVSLPDLYRRKLVVRDCDSGKVLALICALHMLNTEKSNELLYTLLDAFIRGGIPVKVEGEAKLGGSIFIRLLDEMVEIRILPPA